MLKENKVRSLIFLALVASVPIWFVIMGVDIEEISNSEELIGLQSELTSVDQSKEVSELLPNGARLIQVASDREEEGEMATAGVSAFAQFSKPVNQSVVSSSEINRM